MFHVVHHHITWGIIDTRKTADICSLRHLMSLKCQRARSPQLFPTHRRVPPQVARNFLYNVPEPPTPQENTPPVGSQRAYRFVNRQPKLKTCFTRIYDFQRALCEDTKLIKTWYQLVSDMRTKYGVQDCDFYNFDETGFMMGIIAPAMVVTRADRQGRCKSVQPGNREWGSH